MWPCDTIKRAHKNNTSRNNAGETTGKTVVLGAAYTKEYTRKTLTEIQAT